MKILHLYFIRQFLKPFIFGLISFVLIMVVSQLFEKLDTFTGMKASYRDIALYLLYQIPHWTFQVLPVAVLLGGLFSFHTLSMNGEITAVKASGIPLRTVIVPILVIGLLISFLEIIFNESIVPVFNSKASMVYRVNIRRLPPQNVMRWDNIVLSGKGNIRLTADRLNLTRGYLKRVVIDQYIDARLRKQIDAGEAIWTDRGWKFMNGVERYFSEDGRIITKEIPFKEKLIDIYNSPEDLAPHDVRPEEINTRTLILYIDHLKKIGIPNTREKVQLHLKFAFPFANVIVLLIGIPFALYAGKGSGKLMSFGFALSIAFAYWGMISVGQSLGSAHVVPPVVGAWFANIIFGITGIVLLRKLRS